jgi:hypothetical protein
MRTLLYLEYENVAFWYQSSGCYSGDRNVNPEKKKYKIQKGWIKLKEIN